MKITKIEIQKNNTERVNIYIDGKFFCGLDISAMKDLSVKEGMTLTDALEKKFKESNELSKCMRKALSLLNYRDRTSFEIIKKLKEKSFDENEINLTVKKLIELNYLNDDNFISNYINYQKDCVSKQKIIQKLWQFGVPQDLINSKLNQIYKADDEYTSCLKALENKIRYIHCEKDKLVRYLMYKGYRYDTVSKVIKEYYNGKPN